MEALYGEADFSRKEKGCRPVPKAAEGTDQSPQTRVLIGPWLPLRLGLGIGERAAPKSGPSNWRNRQDGIVPIR
jgi:hypothetical protein